MVTMRCSSPIHGSSGGARTTRHPVRGGPWAGHAARPVETVGNHARRCTSGIEIDLFEPIDDASQSGLEEDAREVYRFVGREVPTDVLRISPPV